jgi:hypothetical protein
MSFAKGYLSISSSSLLSGFGHLAPLERAPAQRGFGAVPIPVAQDRNLAVALVLGCGGARAAARQPDGTISVYPSPNCRCMCCCCIQLYRPSWTRAGRSVPTAAYSPRYSRSASIGDAYPAWQWSRHRRSTGLPHALMADADARHRDVDVRPLPPDRIGGRIGAVRAMAAVDAPCPANYRLRLRWQEHRRRDGQVP